MAQYPWQHRMAVALAADLLGTLITPVRAQSDLAQYFSAVWQTEEGGLIRQRDGIIATYLERDGWPARKIRSIREDAESKLWINAATGISCCAGQRHGARLWATLKEGLGTSLHFTLPKYQGEESHAGTAAD